ncbi:hypothetical protein RchiOBHm_Chr5g0009551 [Rosa chinensis]|uniref:Uncharacterized protein n=1 Tax=Rosa chinensis TaxID=74649 RepID=A0A2P6Q4C9_ROSCH|nr:hypothetical protein RchiOBHm_Chr5g0009551 [Rosa chinensis]
MKLILYTLCCVSVVHSQSSYRLTKLELLMPWKTKEFGSGLTFVKRYLTSLSDCDAICFKT